MTFIRSHIALLQLQSGAWHDPDEPCGQKQDDAEVQAQFLLSVPAMMDFGCACGSSKAIFDVGMALLGVATDFGPDDPVTRRIACTWSQSPAFNPAWAT